MDPLLYHHLSFMSELARTPGKWTDLVIEDGLIQFSKEPRNLYSVTLWLLSQRTQFPLDMSEFAGRDLV